MIKISNNLLFYILVLYLSIVCGCVTPTTAPNITPTASPDNTQTASPDNIKAKTSVRERKKHFDFNKNNKAVSKMISSKRFANIKKVSMPVLSRFGFIQVDRKYTPQDEFYCDKYRQSAGMFLNYKGSDSIITFAMCNNDNLGFVIVVIDWDNSYQTRFIHQLKKEIFLMLKSNFKPSEFEVVKKSVKVIFKKKDL